MTVFVRAFLRCNGCHEMFDSSTVPSAATVTEARRDAKRAGWVSKRGGRDYCPGCKETEADR